MLSKSCMDFRKRPWGQLTCAPNRHYSCHGTRPHASSSSHQRCSRQAESVTAGPSNLTNPWPQHEQLLHSLFNELSHLSQPDLQDSTVCEEFCRQFLLASQELQAQQASSAAAGRGEVLEAMQTLAKLLLEPQNTGSHRVHWLPEYGAVVLGVGCVADDEHAVHAVLGQLHVLVVGLDKWEHAMHRTHNGELQPTAVCKGHTVVHAGTVDGEQWAELVLALQAVESQWIDLKKESKKGHQRTPAMVLAMVGDALSKVYDDEHDLSNLSLSQGGFTDVGLHTGHAKMRDTSWALARAALFVMAERVLKEATPARLVSWAVVEFKTWLLLSTTQHLQPGTASPVMINACMVMMQAVATDVTHLAVQGLDMAHLVATLGQVRSQLELLVGRQALNTALRYQLPTDPATQPCECSYPSAMVPDKVAPEEEDTTPEQRRQAAAQNNQPVSADTTALHMLRSIECHLWRHVASLSSPSAPTLPPTTSEVTQLVELYNSVLESFLASASGKAVMQVEARSRQVLVAWSAYCLMHLSVCQQEAVLKSWGVSLKWQQLQHLVLSDKAAVDAALSVAAYLQRHTQEDREVFALWRGSAEATMQFAEEFADSDSAAARELQRIHTQEQSNATAREETWWREVQSKKTRLAALRQQLIELGSKLARAESDVRAAHSGYYACKKFASKADKRQGNVSPEWQAADNRVKACQRKRESIKSEIDSMHDQIASVKKPPDQVVQPLPKDRGLALQVLFFMHMPAHFRHLSRMSFLAQQLMLPRPTDPAALSSRNAAIELTVGTWWMEHYNDHQKSGGTPTDKQLRGSDGPDGNVKLASEDKMPEHLQQHSSVDNIHSQSESSWYPDDLTPTLVWPGSNPTVDKPLGLTENGRFNPFTAFDNIDLVSTFTEQLSRVQAEELQWAMPQAGSLEDTAADRGNKAIARQDLQPDWLNKPGYLTFGALRSFPLGQLHRLCVALHDRALPWGHPAVGVVVRQLLFHIGQVTEASGGQLPTLVWRMDWDQPHQVLEQLGKELAQLADDLESAPREQESVLLLGEMTGYLAAWHPPLVPVARRFAAMTSAAAQDLEQQLSRLAPDEEQSRQRLKGQQSLLRRTSLLCYTGGWAMSDTDLAHMVQLIVLINYGNTFLDPQYFSDEPGYLGRLQDLRVQCHNVMASRMNLLQSAAQRQPDMLTKAVQLVLGFAPDHLQWEGLTTSDGHASPCFEALGTDGHLWSINLLDGTVLLDGRPPSRLPKDITDHPLYRRTFGSGVNFEVVWTQGVYKTSRSISDHSYSFCLHNGALEVVEEVVDGRVVRLELLDPDAGGRYRCGDWGDELPVRLRSLHSHWLSRPEDLADNYILLRGVGFLDRAVHYICRMANLQQHKDATVDTYLQCMRVPSHLQATHWQGVLRTHSDQLTDILVLLSDSPMIAMLSKFEKPEFIHCYQRQLPDGDDPALLFELPRFGLQFLQRPGDSTPVALDYAGYRLAVCQQLAHTAADGRIVYTLPDFTQYLVLEHDPALATSLTHADSPSEKLVLVPEGTVQAQRGSSAAASGAAASLVTIRQPEEADANIKAHCYEVHHRFGHLQAKTIGARLQLAALYAATSTLLPEPVSNMTGAQMAMQLLRQCWTDRPLSEQEAAQLRTVGKLGGHLTPGLPLVQHSLELSAEQLSHLHDVEESKPFCAPDVRTSYELAASMCQNSRMLLTPTEHTRVLGAPLGPQQAPLWQQLQHYKPVEATPCPGSASDVVSMEKQLLGLLVKPRGRRAKPPYPLQPSSNGALLEHSMHEELRASWEVHHGMRLPTEVKPSAGTVIADVQTKASQARAAVGTWLHTSMEALPDHFSACDLPGNMLIGHHAQSVQSQRLADLLPTPSPLDFARIACLAGRERQSQIWSYNPFLSEQSCDRLYEGILVWLQLCVLEDRLARVQRLLAATNVDPGNKQTLVQELSVHRIWDPREHPLWLVFEVEGRLQIRPRQFLIAKHLIDNPGAICQLNMGEGKTRVILPMLALHWADGTRVVRLNLLPNLIDENYQHLHRVLTASVLQRKLFTMPFSRDQDATVSDALTLRASLNHCQAEGGLLLVTPQHRLSLQLKVQELYANDCLKESKALGSVHAKPFLDILDESDEVLHHRFTLIYAAGTSEQLPFREQRVHAVQAVLRKLAHPTAEIKHILSQPGVAVSEGRTRSLPPLAGLRLLRTPEVIDRAVAALHRAVAEVLVSDPPYEMSWMGRYQNKAALVQLMTDVSQDATACLQDLVQPLTQEQAAHVLALRGLLAYGLLVHALQKRHNVEYGINRTPFARKRLAVPYRAALTPAERSEYAQPDVGILLTTLSYYNDGLSKEELTSAVLRLLDLGPEARQDVYRGWLALVDKQSCPSDIYESIANVNKLDPSNKVQVNHLYQLMSHNMEAINLWLSRTVFPLETRQFPQRLSATAWNLVDQAQVVVGFSGTNDNHRLLPTAVSQQEIDDPSIQGTNGRMLATISKMPYSTLAMNSKTDRAAWKELLNFAVREQMDALLDCGAVLAGVKNRDAAEYVLKHAQLAPHFKAVCYHEEQKGWMVWERNDRCLAKDNSPVHESEAFVIYDDAHCRGSDLKLRREAIGLLTLGPRLCKDKLMQAAGRLRQLERGQKLHLLGTEEIEQQIRTANTDLQQGAQVTAVHVLQWVMHNTVEATQHGVLEWTRQGLDYAVKKDMPDRALEDELSSLEQLYGRSRVAQTAEHIIDNMVQPVLDKPLAGGMAELVQSIEARAVTNGKGYTVVSQEGMDEECERELEQEEEEEEEVEVEVAAAEPAHETDWVYEKMGAELSGGFVPAPQVVLLRDAVKALTPQSLHEAVSWPDKLWATKNFLVTTSKSNDLSNDYLRPVDALLVFDSGDVLLLSEREADGLMEAMWAQGSKSSTQQGPAVLLRMAYASQGKPAVLALPAGHSVPALGAAQAAAIRLFNGCTTYGGQGGAVYEALRSMLRGVGARDAAQSLLDMRGRLSHFERSDLEQAVEQAAEQAVEQAAEQAVEQAAVSREVTGALPRRQGRPRIRQS